MAKQVATSSLAAKIKAKASKAFQAAKSEEVSYDTNGNLPGGIEGGIAKLVDCSVKKIAAGKQNAGELMFYAAGVVVSPDEVNGVVIKGLRTSITEPLYDTPTRSRKTFAEHLKWVVNELKKLSPDTDWDEISEDELEQFMADLKEAGPHFRFRTWQGDPATEGPYKGKPAMVNHVWNGVMADYVEGDEAEGVSETTSEEEEESAEEEAVEEVDLQALALKADKKKDQDAQVQLTELGEEHGLDATKYKTWKALADAIAKAQAAAEEEVGEEEATEEETTEEEETAEEEVTEEAVEEEFIPVVDDVYLYKAAGKKKATEWEVKAVFPKAKTVTIKSLEDRKTVIKNVPYTKLSPVE